MRTPVSIIWPSMFIHGRVEALQHMIRNNAFNPTATSGLEVRREWKEIQLEMKETLKEMEKEIYLKSRDGD